MKTIKLIPQPPVITIDGTAGSGKGTISLQLAKKLGWHFLDSGILYRALALLYLLYTSYLQQNSKLFNLSEINNLAINNFDINFDINLKEKVLLDLALSMELDLDCQQKVYLSYKNSEAQDITAKIRSEVCGNLASKVAVFPSVRAILLEKQRHFLKEPGLVADGRDMGTVVFPNAILKFFLDADAKIRATRRHLQLKQMGVGGTLHNRIDELSGRDLRDSQRVVAPLKPALDAIIIDTTTMTISEVFAIVVNQVNLIV